jgi:hypothetical protein
MATFILLIHVLWVLWMLAGLALTVLGLFKRNRFMDSRLARGLHLAGLLLVAAFPLLGRLCPLTVWEDSLRGAEAGTGFLQRFFHAVLYWDLPLELFGAAYGLAAIFTALALVLRPPRKRG